MLLKKLLFNIVMTKQSLPRGKGESSEVGDAGFGVKCWACSKGSCEKVDCGISDRVEQVGIMRLACKLRIGSPDEPN